MKIIVTVGLFVTWLLIAFLLGFAVGLRINGNVARSQVAVASSHVLRATGEEAGNGLDGHAGQHEGQ